MLMPDLLLDTHVWIWLMNGDETLSKVARKEIECAWGNGTVGISAISVWEVGMLEKKQRILLNKPCLEWIRQALHCGILLLPLTPEIAIESSHLPDYTSGDPADRIIIATARIDSRVLVTRDECILAYGLTQRVNTLQA